ALAVAYQVESALTANASYWVFPSLPLRDVVRLPGGHHSTPRSLDLITRARFRRWTNASVTTRPAASTSVVCAGLKDSPAPIAERRGSHGGWQGDGCGVGPAAKKTSLTAGTIF